MQPYSNEIPFIKNTVLSDYDSNLATRAVNLATRAVTFAVSVQHI